MKIEVLGAVAGCTNCKKLLEKTISATKELAIEAQVEYTVGTERLLQHGIMQPPALLIDSKVVCSGFIPTVEKIKSLIESRTQAENPIKPTQPSSCTCGDNCAS